MTATQMKYLLALTAAPKKEKGSVSEVARRFDVNRSTVNRALNGFIEEGVLDEKLVLTTYGKAFLTQFKHRHQKIVYWLSKNGILEETAKEDALQLMMTCSEETIRLLEQGGDLCKACNYFGENGRKLLLTGNNLSQYIPRGDYRVPFAFYKGTKREPRYVSMANEAFCHPGILTVGNQTAFLRMKCRRMERKSMKSHTVISGEMKTMKYECENQIKFADVKDGYVNLPLEAMQFSYLQEEDILQGEMKLFLSSSVEETHPECTALLKLYL